MSLNCPILFFIFMFITRKRNYNRGLNKKYTCHDTYRMSGQLELLRRIESAMQHGIAEYNSSACDKILFKVVIGDSAIERETPEEIGSAIFEPFIFDSEIAGGCGSDELLDVHFKYHSDIQDELARCMFQYAGMCGVKIGFKATRWGTWCRYAVVGCDEHRLFGDKLGVRFLADCPAHFKADGYYADADAARKAVAACTGLSDSDSGQSIELDDIMTKCVFPVVQTTVL